MIERQGINGNMARVVDLHPDSKGQVRSVLVATETTTLERPIQKLVLILEYEEGATES